MSSLVIVSHSHVTLRVIPTKNETSETNVQNFLVHVVQNWRISKLKNLVNHQNTPLNAETKNQASHCHIFKVLDRPC